MPSQTRLSALVETLKGRGHRITPQRVAILQAVLEDDSHPTVEQIYSHVSRKYPMTSLATIYKTVALLKEEGAAMEVNTGGTSRIDGSQPGPHPHLICVRCQRIVDLDPFPGAGLPQALARQHGFQLIKDRVDYFGLCPRCQAAQAPAEGRVPRQNETNPIRNTISEGESNDQQGRI